MADSGTLQPNFVQHWNAVNHVTSCVSSNNTLRDETAEQLKELISASPVLAEQILFFGSKPRGTRAYQWQIGDKLSDLVKQEGPSNIFSTLSVLNMYWPHLFKAVSSTVNTLQLTDAG